MITMYYLSNWIVRKYISRILNVQISEIKNTITSEKSIQEINPLNFNNFVSVEKLRQEFKIENNEMNNTAGIIGSIYNRIALKDLK